MAYKTWTKQFNMNGTHITINIKAAKDEASRLFHNSIHNLAAIRHMRREYYGTLGEKEYCSDSITLFGSSNYEIRDPEGYAAKVAAFVSALPNPITDTDAIARQCREIIDAHIYIEDNRKTPEADAALKQKLREDAARHAAEAAQKQAETAKLRAALAAEHPYLIPMATAGKISAHALGSKNLKTHLNRAFPGVTFRVTSESFSMGDSITASYTDGPTEKEVDAIADQYQEGNFDGMTDMYEYRHDGWAATFGGAKYVHTRREISDERLIQAAADMGHTISFDGYRMQGVDDATERHIRHEVHNTSFYTPPALTAGNDPEEAAPETGAAGVRVRLNPDKDGVEIYFDAKPAEEIRDRLKANRFRWAKGNKCWYHKQTPQAIAFAESLAG